MTFRPRPRPDSHQNAAGHVPQRFGARHLRRSRGRRPQHDDGALVHAARLAAAVDRRRPRAVDPGRPSLHRVRQVRRRAHFPDVDVYAERGSGIDTVVGAPLPNLAIGQVLNPMTTALLTRKADINQEDITNDAVRVWRRMRCHRFRLTDNPAPGLRGRAVWLIGCRPASGPHSLAVLARSRYLNTASSPASSSASRRSLTTDRSTACVTQDGPLGACRRR
jgi:hypothetical protein